MVEQLHCTSGCHWYAPENGNKGTVPTGPLPPYACCFAASIMLREMINRWICEVPS